MTSQTEPPPRGGETTYLEAIRQAMWEEMERDERVFLIGEDVGVYGGAFRTSADLLRRFGESRVVETPISEVAIVGSAAGAAMMGMRPIAEMQFIDFISVGFNSLVNFAAKLRYRNGLACPMVVRGPAGGGVHGGPFHSLSGENYFMNVPGLKIVAPATPYDAKGLLKSAIRDDDPVIYLEHKYLYRRLKDDLPEDDFTVPIGKAHIRREGKDLTVITFGAMTLVADEAAAEMEKEGVSLEIIDLRSIKPYDEEAILSSVKKTSRAIVLHEAPRTGGVGGEIVACITEKAFDWLDAPIRRIAALDTPVPYSPPLETFYRPNSEKLVTAIREVMAY
ncbi:MAG: alpha-ketoacid dehydrogenase subunit beta [Acidobacteria bacterium]|nr:alpha-ketoacid dehydrogenase subunit beta [Acidobacteriota bacterium]